MSDESPLRKRGGLGRGLSSLLGEVAQEAPVAGGSARSGIQMVPVGSIDPHPSQPRRRRFETGRPVAGRRSAE
jgi:ParB family chromosome partitioning protein